MEFRVLGTIEAICGGHPVDLGAARQRRVLAALLVDANNPVTIDQLMDRVWGEHLPQRGRNALYGYLSRLRTILAPAPEVMISRRGGGYVLDIDETALDVACFRQLAGHARAADTDSDAVVLFDRALQLWRGPAFADVDTDWFAEVRTGLDVERHAAELDRTDAALRCGQHAALVGELTIHARRQPLDEHIAGQLILALHRSGRTADALTHYQHLRETLAEELGIDPSAALQQLYQQILTPDPHLTGPATDLNLTASAGSSGSARRPVPRQLPAAPTWFTGRDRELSALTAALDSTRCPYNTAAMSLVTGSGGIGKTWLAVHWAYQHIEQFPDGQLFVDLQGFSPAQVPMQPEVAVRGFLDALGIDPGRIPADPHTQAALFRSLITDRRMLIVLDNAADTSQVTPLLPGGSACTVLVTSRRHLPGLVTCHGARQVGVGVLTDADARRALITRLGADWTDGNSDVIDELLACCAGLPLALGIVAGRGHSLPSVRLAELATELRDTASRLGVLDDDDPSASLPAVLSWSCAALSAEQALVFGWLGVAPGPDISVAAAISLTGLGTVRTTKVLRGLVQASLVDRDAAGRYRMHDLVRLHARDHAERHLSAGERAAALRRVVDFYLHVAAAGDQLLGHHDHAAPAVEPLATECHPLPLADVATALSWFDAERACLVDAQQIAAGAGWHQSVWQLAFAMTTFGRRRQHFHDLLTMWRSGLVSTDHLADHTARIVALRTLGLVFSGLGQGQTAIDYLQRALTLADRADDRSQQAETHSAITIVWGSLGKHQRALEHSVHALSLYRGLGDPAEAVALNGLGWSAAQLGEYDRARAHCQASLALHLHHLDREGAAYALDSLGYIYHQVGDHEQSIDCYQQASSLRRALGAVRVLANTLEAAGHPHLALDRHEQARVLWQEALELCQEQGRYEDAARLRRQIIELGKDPKELQGNDAFS